MRVTGIGVTEMDHGRLRIESDSKRDVLDLLLPVRPAGMRNANGFDQEGAVLDTTLVPPLVTSTAAASGSRS